MSYFPKHIAFTPLKIGFVYASSAHPDKMPHSTDFIWIFTVCRDFFRVSQGPLYGPCPNGKCQHFFPICPKKIPIRWSFLCKSIYVNKLPSFSMDLNQNKAFNQE